MASKKGIALTAGVLILITVASFVIWAIPEQSPGTRIVVSDYGAHLDGIDEQRRAMSGAVSEQFAGVLDGSFAPGEHIESARESSVIVKRQISELLRSGAGEPWHMSYGAYVESLKSLNEYIDETVVVARTIESGGGPGDLERAAAALAASEARAAESLASRPQ